MSEDDLTGQVIAARYKLLRLLGQGGMGAVYEAQHKVTFKRCAVKLLLAPDFGKSRDLIKRFFREARTSSLVESDHIVHVYDSGIDRAAGLPFIAMELLRGEDLEQLLRRTGALDPMAAAKLVLQAATGLAKAHAAGIVHRDIKPANLFITSRDNGELCIKLLDFGIAKVKMENFQETSADLTRSGSMLGTPLYMSPEQAKGLRDIDAQSDVWSLGVLLFELLSGGVPWNRVNGLGALMASIISDDLPLLQDRAPWIAPELAEVVHRAISRDIGKRFRDAGELRDALQRLVPNGLLTSESLRAVSSTEREQIAQRLELSDDGMWRASSRTDPPQHAASTPHFRTTRSRLGIGSVAVGALVLGVSGVYFSRSRLQNLASIPLSSAEALPATHETIPPKPTSSPPLQLELKRLALEIFPEDAQAELDGSPARIVDGKVVVEGSIGSTRRLVLSKQEIREEFVIAITTTGLIPARVSLRAPNPAISSRSAMPAILPKPKRDVEPKTASTSIANPRGIIVDTGEFQ